jgi:hypothetical protein
MDDLSAAVVNHAGGSAVVPGRGRRRLGTFFGGLMLLSGPLGFWVAQVIAGLVLLPMLFVVEHLGVPFTWWQASLWFALATLAWGALTWWTLRRIGFSRFPFLLLAATSMAWAVLPWALFILATSGKGD